MFKQSAIVFSSYVSLQGIRATLPTPSTSPRRHLGRNTASWKPLIRSQRPQYRAYAMIARDYSINKHETLPWPEVTSVSAMPTPYQILNLSKGSPYSKHRFYELVKIYHPDRYGIDGVSDSIPYAIKIERYRLVVAANELLSDPVKRGAYDYYGAGWNGQPGVVGSQNSSDRKNNLGDNAGRGWGGGRGSPFQNATWEDWERWYARDEKSEQTPTYFSNGTFVALIVLFAALGQATRVGSYSVKFIERSDALHDEMSKELMRRRKESASIGNREERVHHFLKQRDPLGYSVTDAQDETCRRVYPEPEVHASDNIKARNEHI